MDVSNNRDLGGVAAVIAYAHAARSIARPVFVRMQKDVAFDPGVGPVQVQLVIAPAKEDIVVELDDWSRTIAAGEIKNVVVITAIQTIGDAEKVTAENPVSAAFDPPSTVE